MSPAYQSWPANTLWAEVLHILAEQANQLFLLLATWVGFPPL